MQFLIEKTNLKGVVLPFLLGFVNIAIDIVGSFFRNGTPEIYGLVRFEAGNLALITCSIPRNLDLSLFQSLKESPRPFVSRMRLKDIVKA